MGIDVDDSWIIEFCESIGIPKGEGRMQDSRLSVNNRRVVRCRYCRKPFAMEQEGRNQPDRCKECAAEELVSQEAVDVVVDSCRYVLDEVYGIRLEQQAAVKLSRRRKGKRVNKSKKETHLWQRLAEKSGRKDTGQKDISIEFGEPRITVILKYLEHCFQEVLDLYRESAAASNAPDSNFKEENLQEKTEDKEKNVEDSESDDGYSAGSEERINDLRVWLVANCLYTIGELAYAQQYIGNYCEQKSRKFLDVIDSEIGFPWNTVGIPFEEILKKLED